MGEERKDMSTKVLIDVDFTEVKHYYFFITCSNGHLLLIPANPEWELVAIAGIQFKCLTCDEVVTIPECFGEHIREVSCPKCE